MLIPLFASPMIGFIVGLLFMVLLFNVFRKAHPVRLNASFRRLQVGSAAYMAFSHGSNDAQKTMGIMTLALVTAGIQTSFEPPLWVILSCHRDQSRDRGGGLAHHQDDGHKGREA